MDPVANETKPLIDHRGSEPQGAQAATPAPSTIPPNTLSGEDSLNSSASVNAASALALRQARWDAALERRVSDPAERTALAQALAPLQLNAASKAMVLRGLADKSLTAEDVTAACILSQNANFQRVSRNGRKGADLVRLTPEQAFQRVMHIERTYGVRLPVAREVAEEFPNARTNAFTVLKRAGELMALTRPGTAMGDLNSTDQKESVVKALNLKRVRRVFEEFSDREVSDHYIMRLYVACDLSTDEVSRVLGAIEARGGSQRSKNRRADEFLELREQDDPLEINDALKAVVAPASRERDLEEAFDHHAGDAHFEQDEQEARELMHQQRLADDEFWPNNDI